jgi:hypothetical protein
MREILPGIHHWTATHEKIGIRVHSYHVREGGVLIDPMRPDEGMEWFRRREPPRYVLLTNRHHYRHSAEYVKAFGVDVRCHRAGLHEFTQGEDVRPFEHGEILPGGVLAIEIDALCPEETAFYLEPTEMSRAAGARGKRRGRGGVVALGDAVIRGGREGRGKLGFVPDQFMGDDPEAVKRGLREALRRLLERDFEHLVLAHGAPVLRRGKDALRDFLDR